MSTLGFPSDAEVVSPAPYNGAQFAEQTPPEPTNEELRLAETGGIDPWFLEGNNASIALHSYYCYGDERRGESISDTLQKVKMIGALSVLSIDGGIKVVDNLSKNEAFLLSKAVFTRLDAQQNANWAHFCERQQLKESRPVLTTGQRWQGVLASVMASSGIAPALAAMPQMAQFGMYGIAAGGIGLGLPVVKAAWGHAKAHHEATEAEKQAEELLLKRGENLVSILSQSEQKLLTSQATVIPDRNIEINLKDLKKQLSPEYRHHDKTIDQQIKGIDSPSKDEKSAMQDEAWGPTYDVVYRVIDYGFGAVTKEDVERALQALQEGHKNKKKRSHTLVFNPAEAVTKMLQGVHDTHPDYLMKAWNGGKKPGIKQYAENISKLQSEIDQADKKTMRIKTINDGLPTDRRGDKSTQEQYAVIRSEKERALHIAVLELLRFSDAVTRYLLSRVFDQSGAALTTVWEQPK